MERYKEEQSRAQAFKPSGKKSYRWMGRNIAAQWPQKTLPFPYLPDAATGAHCFRENLPRERQTQYGQRYHKVAHVAVCAQGWSWENTAFQEESSGKEGQQVTRLDSTRIE